MVGKDKDKQKTCRHCGALYSEADVEEMLSLMFGRIEFVDEDYRVMIWGLCPHCWPDN